MEIGIGRDSLTDAMFAQDHSRLNIVEQVS
jgi:hypothetical protein